MIEIEIVNSPDTEILGKLFFNFPKVEMGQTPPFHLKINDPHLEMQKIILESSPKGVGVFEKNEGPYLSNGKKIRGKKIHAPGDIVTFGKTQLKILRCVHQVTNQENLTKDALKRENVSESLNLLKKEMLKIEES